MKNAIRTATALAVLASTPAFAGDGGWDWAVSPYFWAASISSDLRDDAPPTGGQTAFNDIISKIDMALLVHAEGRGDRFGVFGDLVYLSLANDKDRTGVSTSADLDTTVWELAGFWSPGAERGLGWDLYAGVRYIDLAFGADIRPNADIPPPYSLDLDRGYLDGMLGARYTGRINEKWGFTLRADGAWGETEGTTSASARFSRKTGNGAWEFGYRYLGTTVEIGPTTLDLALSGPFVGYTFAF